MAAAYDLSDAGLAALARGLVAIGACRDAAATLAAFVAAGWSRHDAYPVLLAIRWMPQPRVLSLDGEHARWRTRELVRDKKTGEWTVEERTWRYRRGRGFVVDG